MSKIENADQFVAFVRGASAGGTLAASTPSAPSAPIPKGLKANFTKSAPAQPPGAGEQSYALKILEAGLGLGPVKYRPTKDIILGQDAAIAQMPPAMQVWKKEGARQFTVLLLESNLTARKLLDESLFKKNRPSYLDDVEGALNRVVETMLTGFAYQGAARSSDVEGGRPDETLAVVSVLDDTRAGSPHLLCFGTHSAKTGALEVFFVRQPADGWDPVLVDDELRGLWDRQFSQLTKPDWQDAFTRGNEREKAEKLVEICAAKKPDQGDIEKAVLALLNTIAASFALKETKGKRVKLQELPESHDIGGDLKKAKRTKSKWRGVTVRDMEDRPLGYVLFAAKSEADAAKLRTQLLENNVFHNVAVVYPEADGASVELWQGKQSLKERLLQSQDGFKGAAAVVSLFTRFFRVSGSLMRSPKELARGLADRAIYLKHLVLEELLREAASNKKRKPVAELFQLFNDALIQQSEEEFADAYAQALTYGALAARWLNREPTERFTVATVGKHLPSSSPFLVDLFQKLVALRFDLGTADTASLESNLQWLIDDIVGLLERTSIRDVFEEGGVDSKHRDPVIHFYEDFLDEYNPQLRKDRGVYYTPDEVVSYIVKTTHQALIDDVGVPLGLADPMTWGEYAEKHQVQVPKGVKPSAHLVQILDPATGTGTFLKHVVDLVHETMWKHWQGGGSSDEQCAEKWAAYVRTDFLPRLFGFELMMAPYVVCHLRLGLVLEETGFHFGPKDRLHVYLTNTLELNSKPQLNLLGDHVAQEAAEAEKIKKKTAISVVLGNPPYDRVGRSGDGDSSTWLVSGSVPDRDSTKSLFDDILDVARENTIFSHHASLYNLYVYFWRWAIWKVLEQREQSPGIVSFITASSWLAGPGFVGLRKIARELSDSISTVDLGGDNKGANPEPNIFNIETPVAITTLLRSRGSATAPAASRYQRVAGNSAREKLDIVEGFLRSADPRAGV